MRIAILGATSLIAKDLTIAFSAHGDYELVLFARRPAVVMEWLAQVQLAGVYTVADFDAFRLADHFDALVNFVGIGNPLKTERMGSAIFDTTLVFDQLATRYQQQHPDCRYLFLSSGAVYGRTFNKPVDTHSSAVLPINHVEAQDWYGMAKLYAECRHRALPDLPIIDLRVFNYFSCAQDISARFLMTDIVRAIRDDTVLETSSEYMIRDYMAPLDFHQLIEKLLNADPVNTTVDCYSKAPIDKLALLTAMQEQFGLRYEITEAAAGVNATGSKPYYYSLNRRAADFGFVPRFSSLECVLSEARKMLERPTPGLQRP